MLRASTRLNTDPTEQVTHTDARLSTGQDPTQNNFTWSCSMLAGVTNWFRALAKI